MIAAIGRIVDWLQPGSGREQGLAWHTSTTLPNPNFAICDGTRGSTSRQRPFFMLGRRTVKLRRSDGNLDLKWI